MLLLATVLLAPALFASSREGESPTAAVQPRKNTIVFAVAGEPDDYHMDAVVVVEGKQLRTPYADEDKATQKKFGEEYFAEGRTYRLTFGGGEAGAVKVKKWGEGCNSIHAEISVSTSVRLGGHVNALATNSDALGQRASARRAPTDAERTAVMVLVKSIYSQNHTPASLIPSIKVTNLTATDLDGDGKFEFIGSFASAAKNKFERDLFLIAKPEAAAMRADFVKFQRYHPPADGFLSSIDFVDQLDLDGDGVGEVIGMHCGIDVDGFLIFKKVGGRWRQVFEGIGDAC